MGVGAGMHTDRTVGWTECLRFLEVIEKWSWQTGFTFCFSVAVSMCLNRCEPQTPHLEGTGAQTGNAGKGLVQPPA